MTDRITHPNPLLGECRITNTWPRAGLLATGVEGETLLGRLAADGVGWRIDATAESESLAGAGDPLDALDAFLQSVKGEHPRAGAIGYAGYELGLEYLELEGKHQQQTDTFKTPAVQFLIFARIVHPPILDARQSEPLHHARSRSELDELICRDGVRAWVSKSRYLADVARIKDQIARGDIYQANYTQAFDLRTVHGPEENSHHLRSRIRAPYSAYLNFASCELREQDGRLRRFPAMSILSASPERFWRKRGSIVDSRPIKGTTARGSNPHEDKDRKRQLLMSSKDRAELLMITDLVRNDLGRVADIGSVKTDALVRVRPTPSVWHLESTVTALLSESRTWVDVMKALHPAGSITGTPKHRAVQILAGMEPVARGPYCGALGWVDADGNADFALGIRTCIQIGDTIRVHGGGGIVADSDPEAEYYESLIKIAPLFEALTDITSPFQISSVTEEANSHA